MAVLAAGRWGDFIGWLEGHESSALVLAALLTFLVTGMLVGVTAFYAKRTSDIASATQRQAGASVKMAEATLRPVIEQWIGEPVRINPNTTMTVRVNYENIGSGAAADIHWFLYAKRGQRIDHKQRVAMGLRAKQGWVEFEVPEPVAKEGLLVRAEYQDVLGAVNWSCLPLPVQTDEQGSYVENGRPSFGRIAERTNDPRSDRQAD